MVFLLCEKSCSAEGIIKFLTTGYPTLSTHTQTPTDTAGKAKQIMTHGLHYTPVSLLLLQLDLHVHCKCWLPEIS